MKKLFTLLAILTLTVVLLCACGCDHEWTEADCNDPKTCTKCGATEGDDLGHDYAEADCEHPKTCTRCGKTRGDALGHDFAPADCDDPEICTRCNATGGAALGHSWVDATCEEPQTCTDCGITEGEALGHVFPDYVDCENPPVCGSCGIASAEAKPHTWAEATCEAPQTCTVCGVTEGDALGHSWVEATYEAPKTCSVCGLTEGEPLTPPVQTTVGLGVDLETFHAALEARLWEVGYNYVSAYYTDTEDGGKLYQVCDLSTGEAVDVYLLYYLCADGTTVDTLFSYSPNGQDETLSNLCGVYLGAAMYLLDADNATTNLANMMNNATESDDGMAVTYYTELNGYAYVMYLEQTSDTTIDITCGVSYTE